MYLTTKKYFILVLSLATFFLSCEKVVNIDLKDADTRLVVEGNIHNFADPYWVKLSNSVSYSSENTFPAVSGAKVRIQDDLGNTEDLNEFSTGLYKSTQLKGTPGRTYTLEINANNQTYTAISQMPQPIAKIDSFLTQPIVQGNNNNPTNSGHRIVCKFTDPVGLGNYYHVLINSNNTEKLGTRNSRILEDKITDGQQMGVTFRTNLVIGDTVWLEVQSIDKNRYEFYKTISNAVGNTNANQFLSSLPANPTNNISNKGLGYFSAYSVIKQRLVIQ